MAPPKKKTSGGRTTPKGTKPGQVPTAERTHSLARDGGPDHHPEASTRYTPPKAKYADESPPWLPWIIFGLLIAGMLAIISRYVIWDDSNLPLGIGLLLMLAGLFTATRWK